MSGIFPAVQPDMAPVEPVPLCKEVAWDFDLGRPIYSGGRPMVVTGAEAVKVWCWRALHVVRRRHSIYSWDYGSEVEELVGQPCTREVKESEAVRYVREALAPNPYITEVRQVDAAFHDTTIALTCTISTVYGEVTVRV